MICLAAVQSDPAMFSRLMETVFGANATWACSTEQLLIREESRVVEYKQTARWNVREHRRDKTMEQVVVKTVAGMLNDRGGTLLIGVTDSGEPVGLDDDYAQVSPSNADAYVNWLDTLFDNSLGHSRRPPPHHPNRPDRPTETSAASTFQPAPAPSGSRAKTDPASSTSAATTPPGKYHPTR